MIYWELFTKENIYEVYKTLDIHKCFLVTASKPPNFIDPNDIKMTPSSLKDQVMKITK